MNMPPGFHPKEAGGPLSALSSQCPELPFSVDPPELSVSITNHPQSLGSPGTGDSSELLRTIWRR